MSIQILLTADNHLDISALNFGPKRWDKRSDHRRCFAEALDFARRERADLVLLAGDVFDSIRPSNWTRAWLMHQLRDLHERGIQVAMVSGDHDTPRTREEGASPLAVYGNSGYATYFADPRNPGRLQMTVDGKPVTVTGVGLDPLLPPGSDPLTDVPLQAEPDAINILLTHYPVEGFPGVFPEEAAIHLNSIPNGYQLVAVGHLHRFQHSRVGDTTIVFPGSTERASFAEEDEAKGFVWLEVSRDGAERVQHILTSARHVQTLQFDVTSIPDISQSLGEEIRRIDDTDLALRVRVKGRVTSAQLATYRRPDLLRAAEDRVFHTVVEEDFEVLTPEVPAEPLARTTPQEELVRQFQALRDQAPLTEREYWDAALSLVRAKFEELVGT